MSEIWHLRAQEQGYVLDTGFAHLTCFVGKSGLIDARHKHEGDGATPKGQWAVRGLFYRPDRIDKNQLPAALPMPIRSLAPHDGWCDDANSPAYNYPVRLPFSGRHEDLWRGDGLYDLILPLGYNDAPPQAGKGSAIFLHCADAETRYTKGCVALRHSDLLTAIQKVKSPLYINI